MLSGPGVSMRLAKTLALLLALLPALASAWNASGHAAVAAIAESQLTQHSVLEIKLLLANDLDRHEKPSRRIRLTEIASWADEIRDEATKTDPAAFRGWHVRHNMVCSDTLGECKDGHCVDQLIIHYAAVLADHSQLQRTRNEALKWMVHLVGDLHMPLHSGVNLNGGGARVDMVGQILAPAESTLHKVWDGPLLDHALAGWERQPGMGSSAPMALDAPTQWMRESRDVALHEVYQPLAGFRCDARLAEPIRVDAAYRARSVPVIRQQIERAGLRLAQLLNTSLR